MERTEDIILRHLTTLRRRFFMKGDTTTEGPLSPSLRLHTRIHHLQSKVLCFIKDISGYRVVRIFREYSAFSVVASSALLVSLTNFTEGRAMGSVLFGYAGEEAGSVSSTGARFVAAQANRRDDLAFVPLANASNSVDPTDRDETTFLEMHSDSVQGQNSLFLAQTQSANITPDPEEDGGVKIYTVQSGDTVSTIAVQNGITVNTILWANDLSNPDEIRPGDQIFILPVAGLAYVVKSGDTVDSIAEKYQATKEKIIAFNELPANGDLKEGDEIIIPDGRKETPQVAPGSGVGIERRQYATATGGAATDISGFRKLDGKAGTGHRFPYGYCTWYVAQKRYVPWSGNAGTWLYKAKALGYKTGRKPTPGSIVVTTENRYYGHVALVEKVSGDTITVSEMNYTGWAKMSRRTLPIASRAIKGFIY